MLSHELDTTRLPSALIASARHPICVSSEWVADLWSSLSVPHPHSAVRRATHHPSSFALIATLPTVCPVNALPTCAPYRVRTRHLVRFCVTLLPLEIVTPIGRLLWYLPSGLHNISPLWTSQHLTARCEDTAIRCLVRSRKTGRGGVRAQHPKRLSKCITAIRPFPSASCCVTQLSAERHLRGRPSAPSPSITLFPPPFPYTFLPTPSAAASRPPASASQPPPPRRHAFRTAKPASVQLTSIAPRPAHADSHPAWTCRQTCGRRRRPRRRARMSRP